MQISSQHNTCIILHFFYSVYATRWGWVIWMRWNIHNAVLYRSHCSIPYTALYRDLTTWDTGSLYNTYFYHGYLWCYNVTTFLVWWRPSEPGCLGFVILLSLIWPWKSRPDSGKKHRKKWEIEEFTPVEIIHFLCSKLSVLLSRIFFHYKDSILTVKEISSF